MKPLFAAASDIHRTNQRPICRLEADIMEVQDKKLWAFAEYLRKYNIPGMMAGDLFETWMCGHDVVNSTARILDGLRLYACYGQHELPSHDMREMWRSPLTTILLRPQPHCFSSNGTLCTVTTCSWGEKPKKLTFAENTVNILVLHKTVWYKECPFPGAKGNITTLLKLPEYSQFDVIISGDNHKAFKVRKGKTLWVNCGCMYRTSTTERDYIPSFWVFYWSKVKGRVIVRRKSVPFKRNYVSTRHLEQKKVEKEWDSDFAKTLVTVKGARPSSFVEKVSTAASRLSKDGRKKAHEFIGV